MHDSLAILERLLRRGATSTQTLLQASNVSPSTLRRMLRAWPAPGVVRLGQARAVQYAAVRQPESVAGSAWPLHLVEEAGTTIHVGRLHALVADQWWLEASASTPGWMHWGQEGHVFHGLPWWLDGFRPQGFLGRAYAASAALRVEVPTDPRLWSDDHVVAAGLIQGDDTPGNVLLGTTALARRRLEPAWATTETDRMAGFALATAAVLRGEAAGSSAAGEQPKFSFACRPVADAPVRHMLVKFSPPLSSPQGRRWGDLLVAEHLAAEILREHGFSAAATQIWEEGERIYLGSERFDRVGHHGRRSAAPLDALVRYLGFAGANWTDAVRFLVERGHVMPSCLARVEQWAAFGQAIGNTDMHLGNLSLLLEGDQAQVAPVYDMLPMVYRPNAHGEMRTTPSTLVTSPPAPLRVVVAEYWDRVAHHPQVSATFKAIAMSHLPPPPRHQAQARARGRLG